MLGRIIGAIAGQAMARRMAGTATGPAGAIVGMLVPQLARRLGPLGIAGMALGSWVVGRALAKRAADADQGTQGGVTSTSSLPKLPPV